MSMVVKNNMAAQLALGELNKNNNKLSKSLAKVSSGMRHNSAEDGAAEFSISERMRVRIRGLGQDIFNAQTGKNLVRVAEGGIQEILNNLRDMKAMAINSANDHNTDADRQIIEKEFEQRMAEIDDIAATTNYNGRLLLLGRYAPPPEAASVIEPTGTPTLINAGDYTISSDGVYELAAGYTGNITITATNVKLQQQNSRPLNNVYINCLSDNTHLWSGYLNIINDGTVDKSIIRFNGTDNYWHVKAQTDLVVMNGISSAVVNIGKGLTIQGKKSGNLAYQVPALAIGMGISGKGAAIGTDANEISSANLFIYNMIQISTTGTAGAGIGSGENGSIGDITIDSYYEANLRNIDSQLTIDGYEGAALGTGVNGSCGNISVNIGRIYTTGTSRPAGNGTVIGTGTGGNINGSINITSNAIGIWQRGQTGVGDYRRVSGTIKLNGNDWYSDSDRVSFGQRVNHLEEDDYNQKYTPLIIHTGTNANQNLSVWIRDMRASSMGLDNVKVTPREAALAALSKLDSAVNYALNENTRMGAYQSRLEFTIDNLTTASENTQASESVIRDADMAKEMTEYTKNNVLTQSAQAMLAQANQNSSNVLNLLG